MIDNRQSTHLAFEEVVDALLDEDELRILEFTAHAEECSSCAAEFREAQGIIVALASPVPPAPDLWVARAGAGIRQARAEQARGLWANIRMRLPIMALGAGTGATIIFAALDGMGAVDPIWATAVVIGSAIAATVAEDRFALD